MVQRASCQGIRNETWFCQVWDPQYKKIDTYKSGEIQCPPCIHMMWLQTVRCSGLYWYHDFSLTQRTRPVLLSGGHAVLCASPSAPAQTALCAGNRVRPPPEQNRWMLATGCELHGPSAALAVPPDASLQHRGERISHGKGKTDS